MTGAEYWLGREKEWIEARNRKTDRMSRELEKAFVLAAEDLQKEIAGWVAKYAEAEGITMADAQQRLSSGELQKLKMNLEQFTRLAKENADGRWEKELTSASAAVHVTRLQALELQMKNIIRRLYAGQEADMSDFLTGLYADERERMTYEIQRARGEFNPLAVLPEDRVQKVLQRPWADDGKAFSTRLWGTQNQLINTIQSELVRGIISGRDTGAIGTAVAQRMGAARYAGVRLIQTEATRLIVEADKDTFEEMGIEQVEIVGTLDRNTCDTCGSLDGQVMKRTDARAGSTAPPFHPNCRCCIVPYDEELSGDARRTARDPESGGTVEIPDMSYKDWKAVYVDKTKTLEEWGAGKETKDVGVYGNGNGIINSEDELHPREIAGVKRGNPMTEKQADSGNPNPNFKGKEDDPYSVNCQSCVVTYEARLRGYNIETRPNNQVPGSATFRLSHDTRLAWIDPVTGEKPEFIPHPIQKRIGAKTYLKWAENVIEERKRYTIQVFWNSKRRGGHIVHIRRNANGELEIYDPQSGIKFTHRGMLNTKNGQFYEAGKYRFFGKGPDPLLAWFSRVLYWDEDVWWGPEILRVDDKEFNLDIVNAVTKPSRSDDS